MTFNYSVRMELIIVQMVSFQYKPADQLPLQNTYLNK